jgi:CubicO group peptidase (beta-lactamase class C family)
MISKRVFLSYAAVLILALPSLAGPSLVVTTFAQTYWPAKEWRTSTPEAQGLDSEKLHEALDYIRQHDVNIHSLLIVRNGYVVLDAYFFPYNERDLHDLASVTKSITSTLVGIAIDEGKINSVQQPAISFFPEGSVARNDDRKQRMTIEHLLTMSSGLQCEPRKNELTLSEMRQSNNWVKFMIDLPMAEEPGHKFVYCSGGMHLLSGIISQVNGQSADASAHRSLFEPLGIRSAVWPADPQGVSFGWGDLHLYPRDMAKIGYLWLNRGVWNGRPVVSANWIDRSTRPSAASSEYGYGIWIKPDPDLYEAVGRGGQRISVVPSKNIVVVMTGGGFEPGDVGKFILAALKSDQPLPANPAAVARLNEAVKAATLAPAPKPVAPLPSLAMRISGKTFEFDENLLGLKELSFRFKPGAEATMRSSFNTRRFTDQLESVRRVGLDDIPRISPGGRFNLPVGLKGFWKDNETFVLDYDEIANINHYQFEMKFSEREVLVKLSEKTGTAQLEFAGRVKEKN